MPRRYRPVSKMSCSRCPLLPFLCLFVSCVVVIPCTATLKANEDQIKQFSEANKEFALSLLRQIGMKENVVFSPYSLAVALDMVVLGVKGKTLEELKHVLGYDSSGLSEEQIHDIYLQISRESLTNLNASYVLTSANVALFDKSSDVIPSYVKDINKIHQGPVLRTDFSNPKTVDAVNEWVRSHTAGMISKFMDKMPANTIMMLLNAVYFKGKWQVQFNPNDTTEDVFYNEGAEPKKVPMMQVFDSFPFTSSDDLKVIELPYQGDNISMLVFLPANRSDFRESLQGITTDKLSAVRKQMAETKVNLTLPRFTVEFFRDLSQDLYSLGAKSMFEPGADFSGMVKNEVMSVSQVVHKAVVEVNEEGSKAAAASGVLSSRRRPHLLQEFRVDHPFMFTIIDKRTDLILFLGQVITL